jgi:hypothetical protein
MVGHQAKTGARGALAKILGLPIGLGERLFYEHVLPRLDRAYRQGVVRTGRRRQRDRIYPRILECGVDLGVSCD